MFPSQRYWFEECVAHQMNEQASVEEEEAMEEEATVVEVDIVEVDMAARARAAGRARWGMLGDSFEGGRGRVDGAVRTGRARYRTGSRSKSSWIAPVSGWATRCARTLKTRGGQRIRTEPQAGSCPQARYRHAVGSGLTGL